MHRYQQLADRMLHQFAPELYPEVLTWHSEAMGRESREITARCGVAALSQLSPRDVQSFLSVPGFEEGQGRLVVHPDDEQPPVNSTCRHPRFGELRVVRWSPEAFWIGQRMGAVAWT